MPPKITMEDVEAAVRAIQELAGSMLDALKALFTGPDAPEMTSDEVIQQILSEDQDGKMDEFKRAEAEILQTVEKGAETWWKEHEDSPDPVGGPPTTKEAKTQRQAFVDAGKSAEYLHQLYFDAAKAQKRLTQIGKLTGGEEGIIARMPSIKGIARATEKAIQDEGGDTATLRDLARGTIEVKRLDKLKDAVTSFMKTAARQAPGAEVTRFKNKFKNPTPSGYSDLQMHIRLDGGHICEMQFQCTTLLDFKEMGAYPGRAGHAGSETDEATPGVDWADWSVLLGSDAELQEVKKTIPTLKTLASDNSREVPKDALKSMAKFDDGKWLLNSHDAYNVSRWIDGWLKDKDSPPDAELSGTLTGIMGQWDTLSLHATQAVQAVVTKELQAASGDPGLDYAKVCADLAKYDVPVGPIT
jgi:hypothetical protein